MGQVGQSLNHGTQPETTVEAISQSAQAPTKSPLSDRMEGAKQSFLDVPKHGIDPGELRHLDGAGVCRPKCRVHWVSLPPSPCT